MRASCALLLATAAAKERTLAPGEVVQLTLHGLPFEVYTPARWRPADAPGTHPVLVFLHGRGESGGFDVTNAQSLPLQLLTNRTAQQSCPFITLIPQCPSTCLEQNGWLPPVLRAVTAALRQDVFARWGGDPERTYLTGQSMGGHGAWIYAAQQPRLFAAVAVVCGYAQGPREEKAIAERLARQRLPVAVYHSADDSVIPVVAADRMVAALTGAGYASRGAGPAWSRLLVVRYEHAPPPPMVEFSDLVGHGSYELAYRSDELYAWLLRQRCRQCAGRPPAPWHALHERRHEHGDAEAEVEL